MRAQLTVIEGPEKGRSFTLPAEGRVVIGRGATCDFQLQHDGLSRTHCAIRSDDGVFVVADLGSTNGTWVNGERKQQARLNAGDRIQIGPVLLHFDPLAAPHGTGSTVFSIVEDAAVPDISERLPEDAAVPAGPDGRRERDLEALLRVVNLLDRVEDAAHLFNPLIDAALEVTGARRGAVILPGANGPEVAAARGLDAAQDGAGLPVSRTIVREALEKGHSVLSGNAMADPALAAGASVILHALRSVLCVPVESHERVLGAIYLDNAGMMEAFDEHHLHLVAAVGKQAGVALQRLRLIREMQERTFGTVRSLVAALEAKDRYTRGHSERVGAFSLQIARELDVPQAQWADVRLAGLLHDIGKIGIPEPILNKPARLTDEEFTVVRDHPVAGGRILEEVPGFGLVRDGVRLHHERWDGKGYPEGRSGESIPLVARIVGIADAYDTMAYKRVYREALTKEKIVQEVTRCGGSQFDPAVAQALARLLAEDRLTAPQALSVEHASHEIADRAQ